MAEEAGADREEVFRSEVIDLRSIDLSGMNELPSPVLRASLKRVCTELADGGETTAYFQNALRGDTLSNDSSLLPPQARIEAAENDS